MRSAWTSAEAESSFEHWSVALSRFMITAPTKPVSLWGPRCSCTGCSHALCVDECWGWELFWTLNSAVFKGVQSCVKGLRETGLIKSHNRIFQWNRVRFLKSPLRLRGSLAIFCPSFGSHFERFPNGRFFGGRATATCKANPPVTDGVRKRGTNCTEGRRSTYSDGKKNISRKRRWGCLQEGKKPGAYGVSSLCRDGSRQLPERKDQQWIETAKRRFEETAEKTAARRERNQQRISFVTPPLLLCTVADFVSFWKRWDLKH